MTQRSLPILFGVLVLLATGCAQGSKQAPVPQNPNQKLQENSTPLGQTASAPWVETMQCGSARYHLESYCAASGSDMELNACRSQNLTIAGGEAIRLPHPLPTDRAGLSLDKLFVVQWGCVIAGRSHYGVLYYSQGGGNAEGSENVEFYDEKGAQVDQRNKDWKELNRQWSDALKPVKSIMPLEGVE